MKIDEQLVWRGEHAGLQFKIIHWGKDQGYTPGGQGVWNYYIFLPEWKMSAEKFAELWLKDELCRFCPDSPERVTHDYNKVSLFHDLELHGGITYYAKHGHSAGHRAVEIGCDYSHLWDHERGGGFTVEEILQDVKRSCELAAEKLLPKPDPVSV